MSYILVNITDDAFLEVTEFFNAQLSILQVASSYGVWAGNDDVATVYILDDEEVVVICFSPIQYIVCEDDGFVILTLVATRPVLVDYVVSVTTSERSATGKMHIHMFGIILAILTHLRVVGICIYIICFTLSA